MPALTNSQFLPYQTATDRRCDAPAVWKAFLERFETQYKPMLNLSARLSSVPMAMVERRRPYDIATEGSPGGDVEFDTVVIDTDGMVNLDVSPTIVTPQRPGWYWGFGWIRATRANVAVQDLKASVSGGFAGNSTVHGGFAGDVGVIVVNAPPALNVHALDVAVGTINYWNPDEAGAGVPDPWRLVKLGSNLVPYSFAQMAVIWIADV